MKKNKLPIERLNIELRNADILDSEKMVIEGRAVVFEQATVLYEVDGIEFQEIISRDALNEADFSNCCLKYNHENCVPILARYRNGSLTTELTNEGLNFRAELFNTTTSKDVYTLIKEGGLDKCSFAFTVKESEYDIETHTRRINKIDKVFDISIVDIPAYEDTTVQARSLYELENELRRQELENETCKRKMLYLKTLV